MAEQVLGGRYRIVRHLARGGMAEVYLAHDELLDRPVAVKVLFPELVRDPSLVERFRREAQSVARLNHPNIVSVYDFGQDEGAFYIVMEYVAGRTLGDIIRAEGPMAPSRAIAIAADVAAGLDAAHREGIVHRDVKPANVLVSQGDGVVKVADFGIARATDSREDLTMPGMVIGTATYLSPEQAQGRAVDQRSDVYSLGMVLFEMLTGRAPFRGDGATEIAARQRSEALPLPSVDNPAVSPALDAAVASALALDPARRPPSAAAFRAELLAADRGSPATDRTVANPEATPTAVLPVSPVGPTAYPPPERPRPPPTLPADGPSRRPRGPILALVLAIAVAVAVAIAVINSRGNNKAKTPPNTTATSLAPSTNTTAATTTPTTTPPARPTTATTTPTITSSAPPTTTTPTVPETTGANTTLPDTTVVATTQPPPTSG